MSLLLADISGLVPEGPLHPRLALLGVVAGLAAAAIAGRDAGRWLALVAPLTVGLVAATQGDVLVEGFVTHPEQALVIGGALASLCIGVWARLRWSTATLLAVGGCGAVWTIVADTEAPLLVGAVLFGAASLRMLPGWLVDDRRRSHAVLLVLPVAAAAAGSIGRPARMGPALIAAVVGALLTVLAWRLARRTLRRWPVLLRRTALAQRAGMPTTVVPAATSSTTTAPAPTTAS